MVPGIGGMEGPLLRVNNLSKYYGSIVGCEDINFDLWPGEVMGVVGESARARPRC
jgi:putative phosphonate transport system ATP-binding protein